MTDTFRLACAGIVQGFRDAVLGCTKVYKIDQQLKEEREQKGPAEPATTLARRRAEKKKHVKEKEKSSNEPRVMHRIFLCCAWNGGVFWMSILMFNGILLPGLQWLTAFMAGSSGTNLVWSWIGPMLSWTFSALWILPLFVLSKVVNCFWFQDIADAAYRKSRGRPQLPNLSIFIADMLFSLLLQSFFLIQSMLASFLPIPAVGQVISLIHMCLLYSLYSFEYKWINMGWEVHRRLAHIEISWPYFLGFGLPMALLTSLPSSGVVRQIENFRISAAHLFVCLCTISKVNLHKHANSASRAKQALMGLLFCGCVFSILFPLSIISANEADDMHRVFEFPLKLFGPVVAVSNSVFHHSFTKHQTSGPSKYHSSTHSTAMPSTSPASSQHCSPGKRAHIRDDLVTYR